MRPGPRARGARGDPGGRGARGGRRSRERSGSLSRQAFNAQASHDVRRWRRVVDTGSACGQGGHMSTTRRRSHDAALRHGAGTTVSATVRRILAVWERATPSDVESGATWYGDAGDHVSTLATLGRTTREHAAAVLSHLSPRTPWSRNVAGAYALITTGDAPGCLRANVDRARRALASDDPMATFGGPKTRRFARNLYGDRTAVTVDVWATRVALGAREDADACLSRVGVYDALEHAYRLAAARVGVDPTTMQATTWIVARNGRAA